jgi:hypothetical protein
MTYMMDVDRAKHNANYKFTICRFGSSVCLYAFFNLFRFFIYVDILTVPGAVPKTDIGSFEVSGGLPNRDVYIYWQHIPDYLKNGDNFEYKVISVEENGLKRLVQVMRTAH